jgi:hypothetical protein
MLYDAGASTSTGIDFFSSDQTDPQPSVRSLPLRQASHFLIRLAPDHPL